MNTGERVSSSKQSEINWGFLPNSEGYLSKRERPDLLDDLNKKGFTTAAEMWGNHYAAPEKQLFWVGIRFLTFPQAEYLLELMDQDGTKVNKIDTEKINEIANMTVEQLKTLVGGGIFKPQPAVTSK